MMTKEAKTSARVRRKKNRPGSLRRGPAGEVIMDFVAETIDPGAPEYAVTGIASIERISIDQVRIAKFSRRKDGDYILFYEVWGYHAWLLAIAPYQKAAEIIDRLPLSDGGDQGGGRRKGTH